MTNKPNDVRVSRELLEQLRNVCGDPELWQQATDALAQPATAKVDEQAEFEAAVKAMGLSLHNPATGKYWQYIRCGWMMWQARANLEIK